MAEFKRKLAEAIDPAWKEWTFTVPDLPKSSKTKERQLIKHLSALSNDREQKLTISLIKSEPNRVTAVDDFNKFLLVSFADFRLRCPSPGVKDATERATAKESANYIARILLAGITVNGAQYHFYGHSNSQLKSRSCYLFAGTKDEIARKVAALGDFSKIKTVAKLAKRIGLLFSTAELGVVLQPDRCEDIPDICNKDYNFTDGCGLLSPFLAQQLVKRTIIRFRNVRYLPSVLQIRYRGYKGVLTLEPRLQGQILAKFRDSMRKFKDATDLTLSVVDYSKPYAFGFLNDEIVVLLNGLGISADILLFKQSWYLDFLSRVKNLDTQPAFQFLCFCNRLNTAERLLLDGIESVQPEIRKQVNEEYSKMLNKREEQRCRIFIQKSRLLFGICDPRNVLKEGECSVQITDDNDGQPRMLCNTDVLVTRNPCLHPGDLQKFKAVNRPELSHLKDCIVFPTRGKRPSADLMSGGDLDGDKFFVCWDSDLIPERVSQPAAYPGAREPVTFKPVTDEDRVRYFAQYTSASLGRIKNLYLDWARLNGPFSPECQQLNRLFSQCVDGNRVSVPKTLEDPPKADDSKAPFILDVLHNAAKFAIERSNVWGSKFDFDSVSSVEMLLSRESLALTEFELIKLSMRWCEKQNLNIQALTGFFDFNQLTDEEKAWFLGRLPHTATGPSIVLNGLVNSNILALEELQRFKLHYPSLRWKRVFDSTTDRLGTFLDSLSRTMELFHKKLIVIQIDERLSLAIYVTKRIERHAECQVDDTVRVFAFPHSQGTSSARYRVMPTKVNYRLFCDGSVFQLYNTKRGDTWIFLTHGPSDESSYRNMDSEGDRRRQKQKTVDKGLNMECRASVALNKIGKDIQNHAGRINRHGIQGAEVYVISNRDVQSLRTLDLWLEYVDTQEIIPLFEQEAAKYSVPKLNDIDWSTESDSLVQIVKFQNLKVLDQLQTPRDLEPIFNWLSLRSQRTTIVEIYRHIMKTVETLTNLKASQKMVQILLQMLPKFPFATIPFFSSETWPKYKDVLQDDLFTTAPRLLQELILLAGNFGSVTLEPFRVTLEQMKHLSLAIMAELVESISLTVSSSDLALDLLLERLQAQTSRLLTGRPRTMELFTNQLYGIALDHIDEAAESRSTQNELLRLQEKARTHDSITVACNLRIDAPSATSLRTGDHVRLITASPPENDPIKSPVVVDAIVNSVSLGNATFRCIQSPPTYYEECSWRLQNCGSYVTTKEMFEATSKFHSEQEGCCRVYQALLGRENIHQSSEAQSLPFHRDEALNESQNRALATAMTHQASLLWGPPGTGKTRTVVAILQQLMNSAPNKRILVAAPTHNAVDNVLRKFVEENGPAQTSTDPVRVSTDVRKVSDDLKRYTCDALLNTDINESHPSRKRAQKRITSSRLIFSTCIGSNLGLLRNQSFQIVIIDEASQQTEAMSMVPLVKGCERVVLVGDHVQLRATTGQHAQLVGFDISLFERLYNNSPSTGAGAIGKVMLDTQYRMHRSLCAFPSAEFYDNKLQTAVSDASRPLPSSRFPWPSSSSRSVFIHCPGTEDLGRRSKSNTAQALLCRDVCRLLLSPPSTASTALPPHTLVILTPYTRQLELLRQTLPPSITVSSIDGYQGREADIVVFVTVRANVHGDMGFLRDLRRLNVAVTRARAGLVVLGERGMFCGGDGGEVLGDEGEGEGREKEVWRRLVEGCVEVGREGVEGEGG